MKGLISAAAVLLLLGAQVPVFAATAAENYKKNCFKCHGEGGRGDGPSARVLDVKPADFSDCGHMKSLTADYLLEIVKNGGEAVGKSLQMPAAAKVAEEDLPALIDYVRSFCKQ